VGNLSDNTNKQLTIGILTRSFLKLVVDCGMETNPDLQNRFGNTKSSVDVDVPNDKFVESLDDFSERYLLPRAYVLALECKQASAVSIPHIPVPGKEFEANERYCGIAVQGKLLEIDKNTSKIIFSVTHNRI
jgi:hypothetical protein